MNSPAGLAGFAERTRELDHEHRKRRRSALPATLSMRFLRSALTVFADDIERHARHSPCPEANRPALLPVPRRAGGWR